MFPYQPGADDNGPAGGWGEFHPIDTAGNRASVPSMNAATLFGFEERAFGLILFLGLPWTTSAQGQGQAAQSDVQGVEVLTRGPVHEAFAGIVTFDPKPVADCGRTDQPVGERPHFAPCATRFATGS